MVLDQKSINYEVDSEITVGGRHRALKILIASVVTVLLGLAAGWYFSVGPGTFAFLPNVTGQSINSALTILNSAGVKVVEVHESSKSVPADSVISTDPPGGTLVFGGKVTVHVSTGPKLVSAPNLDGKSLVEATAIILQQGFSVGQLNSWFNSAPIGSVYAYNGSDGSPIADGSKIDLEISLGPIPVVGGMTQATATSVLQVAGLRVKSTTEQYSDTVAKGNVISLVPLSDPIGKSGQVQLLISKGTDVVIMPNVIGQTIAAAQSYLKSLGLSVVVDTNQLTSNWGIAKVKKTSRPIGTKLRIGDSVTIISR